MTDDTDQIVGKRIAGTPDGPLISDLLVSMAVPDGGSIVRGDFARPRVRAAIGVVLERPLHGDGVSREDVAAAQPHVMPAIEVIDGERTARFVLGSLALPYATLDPAAIDAQLVYSDAAPIVSATDFDVRGSIAALAHALHGGGAGVEAGEIILCGSGAAAIDVDAGDHIRIDFGALGSVSVHVVERFER